MSIVETKNVSFTKANTLIVNVDELWLKSGNRNGYHKMLKAHIKELFRKLDLKSSSFCEQGQRVWIEFEKPLSHFFLESLKKIPGIHSFWPAIKVIPCLDKAIEVLLEQLKQCHPSGTFKVETQRINKLFPINSFEFSSKVGHHVLVEFPKLKVDVHNPDLVIWCKITKQAIYLSVEKLMGIGGLPVGSSGKALTLLSGGFDSPVASYLMARRGLAQHFIFFHAYPFVGMDVVEKIKSVASVLGTFQQHSKLYIVPFGKVQEDISKHCWDEYRTILFRLYMLKTCELLSHQKGFQALVTGDSLSQVSSQTLSNLSVLDKISEYSILRPLIGLNKRDILNLSQQIGIYSLSSVGHDDACALLAPKKPEVAAKWSYIAEFFAQNQFETQMRQSLKEAKVFGISLLGHLYEDNSSFADF